MNSIINEIIKERTKQKEKGLDEFDKTNRRNDWITYIISYAGDAAARVFKKECKDFSQDQERFRKNMIKVAALALAAIEAHDKLYTFKAENNL